MRYKGKKIIVTGASGFIGSRLIEKLTLEEGAKVKGLLRSWNHAAMVSRTAAKLHRVDIGSIDNHIDLLEGADVVFHLATEGGSWEKCYSVNVEGTKKLIEACILAGVKRLVFFSSIAVLGPTIEEGVNESTSRRLVLDNPYAKSKIMAEELFEELGSECKLEWTIIRPTYVWGLNSPGFTFEPMQKMLNKEFALIDGGSGKCNAIYVDNLIELSLLAGLNAKANKEIFMVRDLDRITWKELWVSYGKLIDGVDINFKNYSLSSELRRNSQIIYKIEKNLKGIIAFLTVNINRVNNPVFIFILRCLRFGSTLCSNFILKVVAPKIFDDWDLMKYTSPGYLSNSKAQEILGYQPIVGKEQALEATKATIMNMLQIQIAAALKQND